MDNTFKIKTSTTIAELMDAGLIESIGQLKALLRTPTKSSKGIEAIPFNGDIPSNTGEMKTFMLRVIAEAPAHTLMKTKMILESIYGTGKVPSPGTDGRDEMEKLWHMVSPNWKELVKDGFVSKGEKRGSYVGNNASVQIWLKANALMEDEAEAHIPSALVDEDVVEDVVEEVEELDLTGLIFDDLD